MMQVIVESLGNTDAMKEEQQWSSPPPGPSSSSSTRAHMALRTGGAGVSSIEDDKTKVVPAVAPTPAPGGGSQLTYRRDRLSTCAWSPVLAPEDEKPFLPDLYVQYNMQVGVLPAYLSLFLTIISYSIVFMSSPLLPSFSSQGFVFASNSRHNHESSTPENDEVYRIRAQYPYVRYFSYTVYDMRLQTISTLHDTEVRRAREVDIPFTQKGNTSLTFDPLFLSFDTD